jgi:hypothetical protein
MLTAISQIINQWSDNKYNDKYTKLSSKLDTVKAN